MLQNACDINGGSRDVVVLEEKGGVLSLTIGPCSKTRASAQEYRNLTLNVKMAGSIRGRLVSRCQSDIDEK